MKKFPKLPGILAVAALVLLHPMPVHACAVCYGEPDSPMSQGLTWAITSLAVIVFAVLAGVVAFFVQASRRAAPARQDNAAVTGDTQ